MDRINEMKEGRYYSLFVELSELDKYRNPKKDNENVALYLGREKLNSGPYIFKVNEITLRVSEIKYFMGEKVYIDSENVKL